MNGIRCILRFPFVFVETSYLPFGPSTVLENFQLERGQLITVPSYLVKRRKQHFHQLDQYGVFLILGCNGYVWVGELTVAKDNMEVDDVNESEKTNANSIGEMNLDENYTPLETRQNICRIANAVRVLAVLGFNITVEVMLELCDLSTSLNLRHSRHAWGRVLCCSC